MMKALFNVGDEIDATKNVTETADGIVKILKAIGDNHIEREVAIIALGAMKAAASNSHSVSISNSRFINELPKPTEFGIAMDSVAKNTSALGNTAS